MCNSVSCILVAVVHKSTMAKKDKTEIKADILVMTGMGFNKFTENKFLQLTAPEFFQRVWGVGSLCTLGLVLSVFYFHLLYPMALVI